MAPPVYSVEVPGTEDPETGWGPIHRSVDGQEVTLGIYDEASGETVTTSYENFQLSRRKFGAKPFLGHRLVGTDGVLGCYVWSTYEEIGRRADDFGAGLVSLSLCPPTANSELRCRGLLGLVSKNRAEWVIAEQGASSRAIISVPVYDMAGEDSIAHIINQTSLGTVVCSAEATRRVLACKPRCPSLKCVVQMDPLCDDVRSDAAALGVRGLSMEEVESEGAAKPFRHCPPHARDILTLCRTSGTTGEPKTTLLAHGDCVAAFGALRSRPSMKMRTGDVHLSFLPLAHISERLIHFALVHHGAAIGFHQGETNGIWEDIQLLRPTIFPSVPWLLGLVRARLRAGVEEMGGLRKALFQRGYAAKSVGLKVGRLRHPIWDRVVFSKVKQSVGFDRIRLLVSTGGPIDEHLLNFLRIVFGCPVVEGYWLSETAAGGTATYESDLVPGTVGAPLSCNEIRLQDVPDMGYFRYDQVHCEGGSAVPCHGRGEICVRGCAVSQGYFKMADETAAAIDEESWFHTGDVGFWTPDGRLRVIGRRHDMISLAQGELVAPARIESFLSRSKFVTQSFVYGDRYRAYLVACVVVDSSAATAWARERSSHRTNRDLCRDEGFRKAVLANIAAVSQDSGLAEFEVVKAVHLEPEMWEPGSDVLTPTYKLRRHKAEERYQAQIDEMYAELDVAMASTSKL